MRAIRAERFGIVLDGRDSAGDAVLVALEVDEAQLLLVAAALMADGQLAHVVAATGTLLDREQRLVRLVGCDVVVDQLRLKTEGRCRGSKTFDRHCFFLCLSRALTLLELGARYLILCCQ